jgi:hypothetical protein
VASMQSALPVTGWVAVLPEYSSFRMMTDQKTTCIGLLVWTKETREIHIL